MDPNHEIENLDEIADDPDADDSVSVDDFIKELEEKEKDLHIPANTTILEISESFVDVDIPEFLKKDLAADKPESVSVTTAATTTTIAQTNSAKFELMIAELKDEIAGIRAERDELFQASRRRAKDFENYKSRTERERNETFQNQVGNLATQMLPALDNLDRAVEFAAAMPSEQRVEIQQFLDGIVLVNQQINEVLAEMGILPIATVGEVFDPHYHEAVATEESDELEPNTVSAELLRGYRIGERVIRHSMVKVVKAQPAEDSDETIDAETEQDTEPENFDTPDHTDE